VAVTPRPYPAPGRATALGDPAEAGSPPRANSASAPWTDASPSSTLERSYRRAAARKGDGGAGQPGPAQQWQYRLVQAMLPTALGPAP
jgi:hypothetical protein